MGSGTSPTTSLVPVTCRQSLIGRFSNPMLLPFIASRAKVARARHHLSSLGQMIETYTESTPVRWDISVSLDDEQPRIHAHVQIDPVPLEIACAIGDVVHNLRSALDIAATDLYD
jgi:hypothetical protein